MAHIAAMDEPFWKTKTLEAMSREEWESLCDGCGKCCLSKLEDEDSGQIYWTTVACWLLDEGSCQCGNYADRLRHVPDCVQLTPAKVRSVSWLPATCGYKLVAEGSALYWWHPLISGSDDTIHEAGISVRGRVTAFDSELDDNEYFDHIVPDEP